jgi:small-conductance mechanosensitive channel
LNFFEEVFTSARSLIPLLVALLVAAVVLWAVRDVINKRYAGLSGLAFRRQVISLALSFIALIVVIMLLPTSDTFRGQLISFFGILLSAAIALSSTTVLGNIMAGLMLRMIRNFKPGDFIVVGEQFGRVSGQSLAHVEIQTQYRDLVTLPNLYLVSNPVKVLRDSGTIVHAEVSLGYNIGNARVAAILKGAARKAGLEDAFVHVLELGDFSVQYRVAGLLKDTSVLISTRSALRAAMLDALHDNGIEIVSPTFMNTRATDRQPPFIPGKEQVSQESREQPSVDQKSIPEKVIFDKAEEAASLEELREALQKTDQRIQKLKTEKKNVPDEKKEAIEPQLEQLETHRERLLQIIKSREDQTTD